MSSPFLEIPFGEWLIVTFEAHYSKSTYTVHVQGSVKISRQAHVSPIRLSSGLKAPTWIRPTRSC